MVARPPDPGRHSAAHFAVNRFIREENTLYEAWVDIDADIEAINRGDGAYDAATRRVIVNGRTYGIHEDGATYPISGPGLIPVDRATTKALRILKQNGGLTGATQRRFAAEPSITREVQEAALRLWQMITSTREGDAP